MRCLLTALCLSTCFIFTNSAYAGDSDVWDNIRIQYVVEIGWVYRDFVDEPSVSWAPYLVTDSFDEAEIVFDLLMLALEEGKLRSIIDPTSSSSPADVRIRAKFSWIEQPMKVRPRTVSKAPSTLLPLTLLQASTLD